MTSVTERNAPNLLVKFSPVPLILTCDQVFFFDSRGKKKKKLITGTLIRARASFPLVCCSRRVLDVADIFSRDAKSGFRSSTFALWAILGLRFFCHVIK